ncbi:PepSY-associated TM helix domain-containing protein [Sphingosinicella sp.]|uniref:PepSY-associated TM helix domain-containing protein n=1 Tax=Sphingosinicella sp. TaxID=1917971 RepID=UPI0035B3BBD4
MERTRGTGAYRSVWRWHFYAGLFSAPLLIVLTLTGAIYLFDREIDGWWNRDMQAVAAGGATLPLAAQEAAVRRAVPGAVIGRVRLPHSAGEAAVWNVRLPGGAARDVYLDPYRGIVTGTADPALQPTVIVRDLHGNLMGGKIGSHIVELVACWTLVMLATGVWLWWPRRWKLRGVLVPRLSATGRRFWRDLHAIPATMNALLVALLVLTGLPWSAFWGQQFARIGESVPFVAPSPNFKAPPTVVPGAAADEHAMHDPDAAKLPWTIRQMPMPHGSGGHSVGIAEIEQLLPRLHRERFGGGVRIFYPSAPGGVFTISYVPDKAAGQRTIHVDPGTGAILGDIGWENYSPVAKAVEWGVSLHVGREYGLANQLANLAVCLVLIGGVVAGVVLWWRRRPEGELAAPITHADDRLPPVVVGMIAALAVIFPLVGASLLLVLGGRWLSRRYRAPAPVAR